MSHQSFSAVQIYRLSWFTCIKNYLLHDSGSQRANNYNQLIKMLYCRSNDQSRMIPRLCPIELEIKMADEMAYTSKQHEELTRYVILFVLNDKTESFFQSCNKSLINQACSGPHWENIGPRSFLYGPTVKTSGRYSPSEALALAW